MSAAVRRRERIRQQPGVVRLMHVLVRQGLDLEAVSAAAYLCVELDAHPTGEQHMQPPSEQDAVYGSERFAVELDRDEGGFFIYDLWHPSARCVAGPLSARDADMWITCHTEREGENE